MQPKGCKLVNHKWKVMQTDDFSLRNLTAICLITFAKSIAANTSVGVVKSGKIPLSFSRQEKQKEKQPLK